MKLGIDSNRGLLQRLRVLQNQVQRRAGRHPRQRLGLARQGQRDGPGPDPHVREPGRGRREVHAAARRRRLGARVLPAVSEP